jgi:hypothetical protein
MHSVEVLHKAPDAFPNNLVEWFMTEYLTEFGIDLTVVHLDLSDEGVDGWCMRESDYEFIIQIDENLEGEEYHRTLCHEMYHMYQHVKNIPRCEVCAHLSELQTLDRFKKAP